MRLIPSRDGAPYESLTQRLDDKVNNIVSLSALKGRQAKAQGNALGNDLTWFSALKGRHAKAQGNALGNNDT